MIPFTIHEFKLFVPVSLNRQVINAHLDTGATMSSVMPDLAAGLARVEIDLQPIEEKLNTRIDLVFGVNTMLTSGRVWVLDRWNQRIGLVQSGE